VASVKREPLDKEVNLIVEEARMVLPGIQALFGFQLIAVFNERFSHVLPQPAQLLHLTATLLIAVAIGTIMAPAAYHRQVERDRVSQTFAAYASLMITLALAPLLVGISIEAGIVTYVIARSLGFAIGVASVAALFYVTLWYLYPHWKNSERRR
jgi:Family of unknown function (DUF6328)